MGCLGSLSSENREALLSFFRYFYSVGVRGVICSWTFHMFMDCCIRRLLDCTCTWIWTDGELIDWARLRGRVGVVDGILDIDC